MNTQSKSILMIAFILGLVYHFTQETPDPLPATKNTETAKVTELTPEQSSMNTSQPEEAVIERPLVNDPLLEQILELAKLGSYLQAYKLAAKAMESSSRSQPTQVWLDKNISLLQKLAGWEYLKQKKCELAIPLFEESAIKLPKDQDIQKGLMFCYQQQGRHTAAIQEFDRYREGPKRAVETAKIALESFESLQRLPEGLNIVERWAIEEENQEKKKQLEQLITKQADYSSKLQSFEVLYGQFVVVRCPRIFGPGVAQRILDLADRKSEFLIGNIGFSAPESPIEITVFERQDFSSVFSHSPKWASGLFDGRIRLPITKAISGDINERSKLGVTLTHELVHAFSKISFQRGTRFPTWWDEGLAQYLACYPNCSGRRIKPMGDLNKITKAELEGSYLQLPKSSALLVYRLSFELVSTAVTTYGLDRLRLFLEIPKSEAPMDSDSIAKALGFQSFDHLLKTTISRI